MLLIQEQKRQADCIASRLNSPSSKLRRSPPEAQPAFGGLLIRSCWRNEPRFALPKLRRMGRKPRFPSLFSAWAANRFTAATLPRNRCFFRSCFDSSQAPKTVRWRRLRGLEFAPDFRADKPTKRAGFSSAQEQTEPEPGPKLNQLSVVGPIRSCLRNEPRFALPKLRHMGHKPRFQSLFSAKPRTVLPLPRSRNHHFSAPGLIAAKPEKPCDGGVCGTLNLLSQRLIRAQPSRHHRQPFCHGVHS